MRVIKWFSAAFGLAFGTAAGLAVGAAPGDLVLETLQPDKVITQQQFRSMAQLAVNYGAWDSTSDTVTKFCVQFINDHYEISNLHGLKTETSEEACKRMSECHGIEE